MKNWDILPSGSQKAVNSLAKAWGYTTFCDPRVKYPYPSYHHMKESYNLCDLLCHHHLELTLSMFTYTTAVTFNTHSYD